jgi:dihydrofolate reductase
VATEAVKLKAQVGKDLVISGHGLLGQTLLKHHLLDELKLWIHPCFVGRGKLLTREYRKCDRGCTAIGKSNMKLKVVRSC